MVDCCCSPWVQHCVPAHALNCAQPAAVRQERSMQEAISAIGLGTWRLRGRMGEPFEVLAAQLEGAWRHYFTMELKLHPLPEVGLCHQHES